MHNQPMSMLQRLIYSLPLYVKSFLKYSNGESQKAGFKSKSDYQKIDIVGGPRGYRRLSLSAELANRIKLYIFSNKTTENG